MDIKKLGPYALYLASYAECAVGTGCVLEGDDLEGMDAAQALETLAANALGINHAKGLCRPLNRSTFEDTIDDMLRPEGDPQ